MNRKSLALVAAAGLSLSTPALALTDYYWDKHPQPDANAKVGPSTARTVSAPVPQRQRFKADLDQVFGPGRWRETSGYRSRAREDELRREGAGTVAPGQTSHHSMGTPDAPGAYDVVVPGMSNASAAAKLKSESSDFSRVYAEGAHGRERQHLHLEPNFAGGVNGPALKPVSDDNVYLRIVGGRRNPVLGPVVLGRLGS